MERINAEVFLKVVETGSFKAAAKALGYTQAGVSYIVNGMEEETGLQLFIRSREGVRLSCEGEELLYCVRQIRNSERLFAEKISEIKQLESGSVRVRVFNSISIYWLPGIIESFAEKYPRIDVRPYFCENDLDAEKAVYEQDVDCGFFVMPLHTELETVFLKENPLMAAVSFRHPLAQGEYFPIAELCRYPYIRTAYTDDLYLDELFSMAGGTPEPRYTIDNDYSALSMAAHDLGYCIFPEMNLRETPFPLKHLLFDPALSLRIHIGTRSMRRCSRATRAFIEHAIEWVKENT